jgi:hypothetical protein
VDGIASAISADGLSFAAEAGLRLANPIPGGRGLLCCAVVGLPDGRYRMTEGSAGVVLRRAKALGFRGAGLERT